MALEHQQITEQIIGTAFEVYRVLEFGFLNPCFVRVSSVFRPCFVRVSSVFRPCFVRVSSVFRPCFVRVSSVFHPWLKQNEKSILKDDVNGFLDKLRSQLEEAIHQGQRIQIR